MFSRLPFCWTLLAAGLIAMCMCPAYALSFRVSYNADVFFQKDSAQLGDKAMRDLDQFVAKGELVNPEVVIATGHADKNERVTQLLSDQRAKAVKFYLMKLGVPPSRIYAEGKGDTQPAPDGPLANNRRADVEFVGTPFSEAKNVGFTFMQLWNEDLNRPRQDIQKDEWSGLSPLQFLPSIQEPHLRERFLRKLQLVAIRDKNDEQLRALRKLDSRGGIAADDSLPLALYALAFGTPYANQLLGSELRQLAVDDPRRSTFARRLWCDSVRLESLATVVVKILSAPNPTLSIAPIDQFPWVWCAAQRGSEEDLVWLREGGVNLDASDDHGQTALHLAVLRNNLRGVEALLAARANPNARNMKGAVPLHGVLRAHNGSMTPSPPPVRLRKLWDVLVEAGADVRIKDTEGRMPLDVMPPALSQPAK